MDKIFNTPSTHRVHHGANPQYIDKNYGGIFILWDRLFGTYEPESEKVVYGLTKQIGTSNPLLINFHEFVALLNDCKNAASARECWHYLVNNPQMEPGKLVLNMGNHDSVVRDSTTLIRTAMKNLIKKLCLYLSGSSGISILFGCALNPAASDYLDYQTKTNLMFPLTGESLIAAGGRTIDQNPAHIYVTDQRFAIDIVALAPGSSPPPKEGFVKRLLSCELKQLYQGNDFKNNANHYCFGRLIIAPGDGMVADTKDGVYDNVPGKRNTRDIPGNYVVIDHLNGEFSMLAHFRKDSVLVKRGDRVSTGDPLGQCGNSGHSNLPHVHYHLQNTRHWLEGGGLPAQFQTYYANGKFIERGEPVQREIISQTLSR